MLAAAALAGPAAATDDAAAPALVIAPGQDDLLAAMLGRGDTLADACALTGGLAESRTVTATYSCAWDEVVIVLRHPSAATAPAVATEQFAITVERGSPPPDLVPALAARVRAREASFRWAAPAYEDLAPPEDRVVRGE